MTEPAVTPPRGGIPAESLGAATALGMIVTGVATRDAGLAIGGLAGIVPLIVTAWLRAGGLLGVRDLFLRGKRPNP